MLYPITAKEVHRIFKDGHIRTAQRHLSSLRAALNRTRFQKVILHEFCEFENIDFEMAKKDLGLK